MLPLLEFLKYQEWWSGGIGWFIIIKDQVMGKGLGSLWLDELVRTSQLFVNIETTYPLH